MYINTIYIFFMTRNAWTEITSPPLFSSYIGKRINYIVVLMILSNFQLKKLILLPLVDKYFKKKGLDVSYCEQWLKIKSWNPICTSINVMIPTARLWNQSY